MKKSVIGIPKTIDNDIQFLDKSFGFETAFAEAVKAINSAHVESLGSPNGVGLVKLMGRDSGFITSFATLAGSAVNFALIPEVPFALDGARGLLEALRYHLAKHKQAVIVVAEGAGQDLLAERSRRDRRLRQPALRRHRPVPARSASTRSSRSGASRSTSSTSTRATSSAACPPSPQDNVYCMRLAQNAVHAAMAGKTNMLVGRWHCTYVHLPLELIMHGRRKVDPHGELWHSVLENTGQPGQLF